MRQVLVTGANKGIGYGIAKGILTDHDDTFVFLGARDPKRGAAAVAELKALDDSFAERVRFVQLDVTSDASVAEAVETVRSALGEGGRLYGLVNNAGVGLGGQTLASILDVNVVGMRRVSEAFLPLLDPRRGRIVNIVSTSGQTGMPGQVNYSAAKAGLIGATKALAKEVARSGVLVNAVSPGFIETDMTKDLPKADLLKMVPLRRFGTAAEVAGAVAFLCSDDAAYVTGHVLNVNGGIHV